MLKAIYTYAFIKTLHDQREDYLDTFFPLIAKALTRNDYFTLLTIQKKMEDKFVLKIPIYVIENIIKRAKKRGYIQQKEEKERRYRLTEKGEENTNKKEAERDVDRRVNSLIKDLSNFFSKAGKSFNEDKATEILFTFIDKNIENLREFISCGKYSTISSIQRPKKEENILLFKYVKEAEHNKAEYYQTLKDLIFGSIISSVLCVKDGEKLNELRKSKFKNFTIYLDSNFLFSLLGFDHEELNTSAKETYKLLKKFNFKIKIFSFTVNEISRVMNGYRTQQNMYVSAVKVDTIYSTLKRRRWTGADVQEFIINIEKELEKKGIEIEHGEDKNLKSYKPEKEEYREKIKEYKGSQSNISQNHDLLAIDKIRKKRGKSVYDLEKANFLFLTRDAGLHKFNLMNGKHIDNATISEVILDKVLTNILWLKNPDLKLSLPTIVALHSRDLFVKRNVWKQFYKVVAELKKKGKIKISNLSSLFYHRNIENVLRSFDEEDCSLIDEDFVMEQAELASKDIQKDKEKEIKDVENRFFQNLDKKVLKEVENKNQEWLDKINSLKEKSGKKSEERTKKWIRVIKISIFIITIEAVILYPSIGIMILPIITFCFTFIFGKHWEDFVRSKFKSYFFSKEIGVLKTL